MSVTLTTQTHTQRQRCLSEQTHIIVQASSSSTLTLCLFESPLNNIDLVGSRKTHETVIWCHRGQRAGLWCLHIQTACVRRTNPTFIHPDLLVQLQKCRETKTMKAETQNRSFSTQLSRQVLYLGSNHQVNWCPEPHFYIYKTANT